MEANGAEHGRTRLSMQGVGAELWTLAKQYRGAVTAALACLVLAKLATVLVPLVLKRIIESLGHPETLAAVPVGLLAGYALLRFASTLLNELRDLLFAPLAQHTVSHYAQRTFAHLHQLGARFHGQRQLGGLLPDIDRGTSGLSFLLGTGVFTLVPTLLEIALVLGIVLANFSARFALIIAATFLAYGAYTLFVTSRRTTYQRRVNKLDSSAKTRLADSLINYETVKYFTNEKVEEERFGAIMADWRRAAMRNQRALFVLHVGQSAIIAVGVGAIMLLAGQQVAQRQMTVGDLVMINAYVLQVCLPLNSLGFVYREVRDAWVNVERLFGLLQEKPEIQVPPGQPDLPPGSGDIVFEDVSFAYEPTRPLLQDVSLRIPAGKTIAVVGSSGSGKSTLARLLLRFYGPTEGSVSIDGHDLRTVTPQSVRRRIGVVPQDTVLFNETIAYNIGYGRIGASREEIVAAARAAHLDDFIRSLPEGYDTMVGERGVKLSGGERQRIAIARIVLKAPPILVLDEATSALDARSERAIQAELERLGERRTVLVIAHRLGTVVTADEIIVLERGRITERGAHEALLEQGGLYARLWELQQRADDVGQGSAP
jgi:ATP-binding cassette subfamily B protein